MPAEPLHHPSVMSLDSKTSHTAGMVASLLPKGARQALALSSPVFEMTFVEPQAVGNTEKGQRPTPPKVCPVPAFTYVQAVRSPDVAR